MAVTDPLTLVTETYSWAAGAGQPHELVLTEDLSKTLDVEQTPLAVDHDVQPYNPAVA